MPGMPLSAYNLSRQILSLVSFYSFALRLHLHFESLHVLPNRNTHRHTTTRCDMPKHTATHEGTRQSATGHGWRRQTNLVIGHLKPPWQTFYIVTPMATHTLGSRPLRTISIFFLVFYVLATSRVIPGSPNLWQFTLIFTFMGWWVSSVG